jgi:hypothetical protein
MMPEIMSNSVSDGLVMIFNPIREKICQGRDPQGHRVLRAAHNLSSTGAGPTATITSHGAAFDEFLPDSRGD